MAQGFTYPVEFFAEETGGFMAKLPDFPEVITQGEDYDGAMRAAADALDEAVAGRIRRGEAIPEPSAREDRTVVSVSPILAAKAALSAALSESGLSQSALAAKLECDEKEIRRLLDPRHPSKMPRLQDAIERLGKNLELNVDGIRRHEISRAHAVSYRDLERHAERLAEDLFPTEVAGGQSIPVVDALRQLDRVRVLSGCQHPIEAKVSNGMTDEGATEFRWGKLILQLRRDVWSGAEGGVGRSRFTAAHELAHALWHGQELATARGRAFRDASCTASEKLPPNVPIYESPEWQANSWAGAFLMPFRAVKAYFAEPGSNEDPSIDSVARHFQVSAQVAEIRIQKLFVRLAQDLGERV